MSVFFTTQLLRLQLKKGIMLQRKRLLSILSGRRLHHAVLFESKNGFYPFFYACLLSQVRHTPGMAMR